MLEAVITIIILNITAYVFSSKKVDRFIFSLQETHISTKNPGSVRLLWKEGIIISPSCNNARGGGNPLL